jgi:hypothetical protein
MPSAGKLSVEPGANDLLDVFRPCDTSADRKHVCIVVFTSQSRDLRRPCDSRAHTRHFVRCDRHSGTRTTHEQSLFNFAVRHLFRNLARVLRVINRVFRDRAEILKLNAEVIEQRFQLFFLGVTRVITCESNSHLSAPL